MKGLLWKEWYQLVAQGKITLLAAAVIFTASAVMLAHGEGSPDFLVYACFLLGIFPMTLFAYDESAGWVEYSYALPVRKAQLTGVKYLLGLLCTLLGTVCSGIFRRLAEPRLHRIAPRRILLHTSSHKRRAAAPELPVRLDQGTLSLFHHRRARRRTAGLQRFQRRRAGSRDGRCSPAHPSGCRCPFSRPLCRILATFDCVVWKIAELNCINIHFSLHENSTTSLTQRVVSVKLCLVYFADILCRYLVTRWAGHWMQRASPGIMKGATQCKNIHPHSSQESVLSR